MPLQLTTFSELSPAKISNIISAIDENTLDNISSDIKNAKQNPEHQKLISDFKDCEDKKLFIEQNQQKITKFLNDCGIMGYKNESGDLAHDNYVIGAEGLDILLSYLANKEGETSRKHDISTVKNIDLLTSDEKSSKHQKIFLQNQQIHSGLALKLQEDLEKCIKAGEDFEKTYVVEVFGTTGGNHIVAMTIRKNFDEESPLIHLFDPSPSIIRNGIEATENSISAGWNSQIIMQATLKKVFEEKGFKIASEKFFNNSEPYQQRGFVYCGTLAIEEGNFLASLSRQQHEELLKSYQYQSPFGGRTEIASQDKDGTISAIDIDKSIKENNGYIQNPALATTENITTLSQFVDPSLTTRQQELAKISHLRKDGSTETELEHITRYQDEGEERKGFNLLLEQKSLRQKIGHLFEIIASDEFPIRSVDNARATNQFDGISPYFPRRSTTESIGEELCSDLINAIDSSLPPTNRITDVKFDGNNCEISLFIGKTTANKIIEFFKKHEVATELQEHDFSKNLLPDVAENLSKSYQLTCQIPQSKFAEISESIKELKQFYKPDPSHIFYPKKTAPSLKEVGREI
jgi:hypothetical protein